jgi:hypothetical protein
MSHSTFQVAQEEDARTFLCFTGSDTVSQLMLAWINTLDRPAGDIRTVEVAHEFTYHDHPDGSMGAVFTGRVRITLHFADGETRWKMFKSDQVQSGGQE